MGSSSQGKTGIKMDGGDGDEDDEDEEEEENERWMKKERMK